MAEYQHFDGETFITFDIVDGTVTISSEGSYDTYGYLYSSELVQLTSNDDSGTGNNFSFSYSFVAGEKYYIVSKMLSSSATGSFTVTLSQQ